MSGNNSLSPALLQDIKLYIAENLEDLSYTDMPRADAMYLREPAAEYDACLEDDLQEIAAPCAVKSIAVKPGFLKSRSIDDVLGQLDESFSERVLRLIDEKGMTDSEVYKRAGLDRRLFAKLRKDDDYTPSKSTALALTIGLKLSLDEASDLLDTAGFTISHSKVTDLVVEYFLKNGIYDIIQLNEALDDLGQKPLSSA